MMVYANPTPSRRKGAKVRRAKVPFVPLKVTPSRVEVKHPSAPIGPYKEPKDLSFQKEVSAKYTVAIAYNKGAYQVISKENIKDIGK